MELPGKLYTMFHYNNKNRRVNLKICILHLINYHTSSVLEQNGPQAAATWRWCSRCCSPSAPPSTAPLTRHRAPHRGHDPGQLRPPRCTRWLLLPPTTAACHPPHHRTWNQPPAARNLRTNRCGSPPRAAQGSNLGSSSMCGKWGD